MASSTPKKRGIRVCKLHEKKKSFQKIGVSTAIIKSTYIPTRRLNVCIRRLSKPSQRSLRRRLMVRTHSSSREGSSYALHRALTFQMRGCPLGERHARFRKSRPFSVCTTLWKGSQTCTKPLGLTDHAADCEHPQRRQHQERPQMPPAQLRQDAKHRSCTSPVCGQGQEKRPQFTHEYRRGERHGHPMAYHNKGGRDKLAKCTHAVGVAGRVYTDQDQNQSGIPRKKLRR